MNAENFSQYLEQPAHLYQITYQEIKSLVLQYPYCQNLRFLLARKSQFDRHKNAGRNLKMAAMYYTDRAVLFQQFSKKPMAEESTENYVITADYLELSELGGSPVSDDPSSEKFQKQQSILFEDFESLNKHKMKKRDPDKKKKPPLPFELPISKERLMFIEDLINEEGSETEEAESVMVTDTPETSPPVEKKGPESTSFPLEITNESQLRELPQPAPKSTFSSWLKQYPSPQLSIHYNPEKAEQKNKDGVQKDKPQNATVEKKSDQPKKAKNSGQKPNLKEGEVVTETLAGILADQGNHQKAMEMYEKLSLIFPEKSAFFAQQIQKLKNP